MNPSGAQMPQNRLLRLRWRRIHRYQTPLPAHACLSWYCRCLYALGTGDLRKIWVFRLSESFRKPSGRKEIVMKPIPRNRSANLR